MGIGSSIASTVGGIGNLLAGGGLFVSFVRTSQSIDRVAKSADTLGVGTEELVGLHHAADLAGASSEALDSGLSRMLRTIGKAGEKSPGAIAALKSIGLSVDDVADKRADEQFGIIADSIKSIQDPAKRTADAMKIFGPRALSLMPLMLGGSKGIKEAVDETVRLGMSFSRIDAAKVEAANDAFTTLKGSISGVFQQVMIQIAPALTDLFLSMASGVAKVGPSIADAVGTAVSYIKVFSENWQLAFEFLDIGSRFVWNQFLNVFIAALNAAIAGLKVFVENFGTIMADIFPNTIGKWQHDIGTALIAIGAGVSTAYNNMSDLIFGKISTKQFGASILASMINVKDAVDESWQEMIDHQKSPLKDMGDAIRNTFIESLDNAPADAELTNRFEDLKNKVKDLMVEPAPVPPKPSVLGLAPKDWAKGAVGAVELPISFTAPPSDWMGQAVLGPSTQLAKATQFGTTEAASQILAAVGAIRGRDTDIAQNTATNTERTAENTERIVDKLDNLEPPDFDIVEEFA